MSVRSFVSIAGVIGLAVLAGCAWHGNDESNENEEVQQSLLWFSAHQDQMLVAYLLSDLEVSGSPEAVIAIDTSGFAGNPQGLALGRNGSLWMASWWDSVIVRFDAAQFAGGAVPTAPAYSFGSDDMWRPMAIAFDDSGNLWVADDGYASILVFPGVADITATSETPQELNPARAYWGLVSPYGLALSPDGSLVYVADLYGSVYRFALAELEALPFDDELGEPWVKIDVESAPGSIALGEPNAVAFDPYGNLWVSDYTRSVRRITEPSTTITGSIASDNPGVATFVFYRDAAGRDAEDSLYVSSIAFDRDGNLWVEDGFTAAGELLRFSSAALETDGGDLTAQIIIGDAPVSKHAGHFVVAPPPPGLLPLSAQ